jgi:hypothetical protein
MVLIAVTCSYCQSDHIAKHGKTETGKQRYRYQNPDCPHQSVCFRECRLTDMSSRFPRRRLLVSLSLATPSHRARPWLPADPLCQIPL